VRNRTKTWLAKIETCLSFLSKWKVRHKRYYRVETSALIRMSENVGHKVENAVTERKRRTKSQKRVYRAKTLIVERRRVHIAKTLQPGQNWTLAKGITLLPSENVDRKTETAFTERNNLRFQSRKRVYRAKMSLTKAKTPFTSENAITEWKRGSERRKRH